MTAETCDQMRARLATYVAARDNIVMGKQVASFGHGENHQAYAAPDLRTLNAMITGLKGEIACKCPGNGRANRVIHITPSDGSRRW